MPQVTTAQLTTAPISITAPFVLIVAGILLIIAAIVGGGFQISAISFPTISTYARVTAFVVGIFFLLLGFGKSNDGPGTDRGPSTHETGPSTPETGPSTPAPGPSTPAPGLGISEGDVIPQGEVAVIAQSGSWKAYAGRQANGTTVCGISEEGTGKALYIKRFDHDSTLYMHAMDDNWNISPGTRIRVTIQFDNKAPWKFAGYGDIQTIEVQISIDIVEEFLGEFISSRDMYIAYDSEASWQASLTGSADIVNSFTKCLSAQNKVSS